MGIGIPAVYDAFKWYRQNFGMDIPLFDEAAEAALMLPYTGGQARKRHAILAVNIQGGGGLEIWQYTERKPAQTFKEFKAKNLNLISDLNQAPNGGEHFFVKDPYNNICEVVASNNWFKNDKASTGGVYGCIIGVSDIDKARTVYSDILGYDEVIYDQTDTFNDLSSLPGGGSKFRRILLRHTKPRKGAFSRMLGNSEIELVQVLDRTPRKIYEDRLWGDLGFIHLCFDIRGMAEMKTLCESKGHPFTADSGNSFDMGEAAGHFSYIEDPDGTLIEFVETHKLPILKKVNWYLNLKNRAPEKPLPNWMLKTLALSRVKD